jgi:hypothetical protein
LYGLVQLDWVVIARNDDVGTAQVSLTYFDSQSFDKLVRRAQARRIDQPYWPIADLNARLDCVSRGTRDISDDCPMFANYRIEQGRLPDVRSAGNYHDSAITDELCRGSCIE